MGEGGCYRQRLGPIPPHSYRPKANKKALRRALYKVMCGNCLSHIEEGIASWPCRIADRVQRSCHTYLPQCSITPAAVCPSHLEEGFTGWLCGEYLANSNAVWRVMPHRSARASGYHALLFCFVSSPKPGYACQSLCPPDVVERKGTGENPTRTAKARTRAKEQRNKRKREDRKSENQAASPKRGREGGEGGKEGRTNAPRTRTETTLGDT